MIDYDKLKVKIGLEVHQELNTNKLFCKCPSTILEGTVIKRIKRKLRLGLGELGKLDTAASYELSKQKTIIYEVPSIACCEVELDQEPPHIINQEALDTVLQIALLLKATILERAIVMRKVVLDGSNTSGFQRTALIAVDGKVETSKGIVNIPGIYLEEESARKVSEDKTSTTYSLDRLGIPLVEISTAPDIKDAEHAKEVASTLGMILRSTGKVKRGLGTIRQDLNLSIKNEAKIEIKGFQDLRSIPLIIENEIKRLSGLSKIVGEVRKANEDLTTSFLRPMPGPERMYPETDIPILIITKERISKIKLPELLSAKTLRLEQDYKLNPEMAREVVRSGLDLDYYANEYQNVEPSLIVRTLIEAPKEIKSRFNLDPYKIKEQDFKFILAALNNKEITKEAILDILTKFAQGHKPNLNDYKQLSPEQLEQEVKDTIEKNKDSGFNAVMGMLMSKHRGKIDAKLLSQLINKYISKQ